MQLKPGPSVYIDHNIWSAASDVEHTGHKIAERLLTRVTNIGSNLLCSHIHIREARLGNNFVNYDATLKRHGALFFTSTCSGFTGKDASNTACPYSEVTGSNEDEHLADLAFDALENQLVLIQKMSGGLRDLESSEIKDLMISETKKFAKGIAQQTCPNEAALFAHCITPSLEFYEKGIKNFDFKLNISATSESSAKYRDRTDNFGKLQSVPAQERALEALEFLEPFEREGLMKLYPQRQGKAAPMPIQDISSFAFALFHMGIGRNKNAFSGKNQRAKYAAQFRDCLHIAEASKTSLFITSDKGAATLAAACYGYFEIPCNSAYLNPKGFLKLL